MVRNGYTKQTPCLGRNCLSTPVLRLQKPFVGIAVDLDDAVLVHHFLRVVQVQAFPGHLHSVIRGMTDRNAVAFPVVHAKKLILAGKCAHALFYHLPFVARKRGWKAVTDESPPTSFA
jgi:hypothetical protein